MERMSMDGFESRLREIAQHLLSLSPHELLFPPTRLDENIYFYLTEYWLNVTPGVCQNSLSHAGRIPDCVMVRFGVPVVVCRMKRASGDLKHQVPLFSRGCCGTLAVLGPFSWAHVQLQRYSTAEGPSQW
eukprot:4128665-Amphidinium_carterae.1